VSGTVSPTLPLWFVLSFADPGCSYHVCPYFFISSQFRWTIFFSGATPSFETREVNEEQFHGTPQGFSVYCSLPCYKKRPLLDAFLLRHFPSLCFFSTLTPPKQAFSRNYAMFLVWTFLFSPLFPHPPEKFSFDPQNITDPIKSPPLFPGASQLTSWTCRLTPPPPLLFSRLSYPSLYFKGEPYRLEPPPLFFGFLAKLLFVFTKSFIDHLVRVFFWGFLYLLISSPPPHNSAPPPNAFPFPPPDFFSPLCTGQKTTNSSLFPDPFFLPSLSTAFLF